MSAGVLSADADSQRNNRTVRRTPGRKLKGPRADSRRSAVDGMGVILVKLFLGTLVVLLWLLQYRLWVGDGGMSEIWRFKQEIAGQQHEIVRLRERNEALEAEVMDLKQGEAAIEERARNELGMIRHDETFYQAVEDER